MVIAIDDSTASTSRRRSIETNQTAYTGASAGSDGLSALKSKVNRSFFNVEHEEIFEIG